MKLSKTELLTINEIAKGSKNIKELDSKLSIKKRRIYTIIKNIEEKGIIKIKKRIEFKEIIHIKLLIQILNKTENIIEVMADSGITILTSLLEDLTMKEISEHTKFKKTIIYKKLKEAKKRSIILKKENKYSLNKKLWPELIEFLKELKKYESTFDSRIPINSTIYLKEKETILFSSKEETTAEKTAFSTYEKYGIKILNINNYYFLPKKELSKKDILLHSIFIYEKDKNIQNLIFIALFYLKFKKEINLEHKVIKNIEKIMNNEIIQGYPTFKEIKDRAEIYGIKLK